MSHKIYAWPALALSVSWFVWSQIQLYRYRRFLKNAISKLSESARELNRNERTQMDKPTNEMTPPSVGDLAEAQVRAKLEVEQRELERLAHVDHARQALLAEVALLRPVVDAVVRWRQSCDRSAWSREAEYLSAEGEAVLEAVEPYLVYREAMARAALAAETKRGG